MIMIILVDVLTKNQSLTTNSQAYKKINGMKHPTFTQASKLSFLITTAFGVGVYTLL